MIDDIVSEISRLEQARLLLRQIKSPKKMADIAREVEKLLGEEEADRNRPLKFGRVAKRGSSKVIYKVEDSVLGETLAEHRPGGKAKPFRCPKPLYERMIKVFAEATIPMTMQEVATAIEKATGHLPGDHQYRPAMRLWLNVQPPVLARSRSRYFPLDAETFPATTNKLWASLRKFSSG